MNHPIIRLFISILLWLPTNLTAASTTSDVISPITNTSLQDNRKAHPCQRRVNGHAKFQEELKAYICNEAKLTSSECDAFFPQFFELKAKLRNLQMQEDRTLDNCSFRNNKESDYDRVLNQVAQIRKKRLNVENQYFKRFRKILSAEKLTKILTAERKFSRDRFHDMFNQHRNK